MAWSIAMTVMCLVGGDVSCGLWWSVFIDQHECQACMSTMSAEPRPDRGLLHTMLPQ